MVSASTNVSDRQALSVKSYSSGRGAAPPLPRYATMPYYKGQKITISNLNRKSRFMVIYCSRPEGGDNTWDVTAGALDLSKAPTDQQVS